MLTEQRNLLKKIASLNNSKIPTGNPKCPPQVKLAKRLNEKIKEKSEMSDADGSYDGANGTDDDQVRNDDDLSSDEDDEEIFNHFDEEHGIDELKGDEVDFVLNGSGREITPVQDVQMVGDLPPVRDAVTARDATTARVDPGRTRSKMKAAVDGSANKRGASFTSPIVKKRQKKNEDEDDFTFSKYLKIMTIQRTEAEKVREVERQEERERERRREAEREDNNRRHNQLMEMLMLSMMSRGGGGGPNVSGV